MTDVEIYDMADGVWHLRPAGQDGPVYQTLCETIIRTSPGADPEPTRLGPPVSCPGCFQ